MITSKMTRADVEAVLADGGNFTKVGLAVFAENFFEYGYQNINKRFYKDELEELLSNLEMNARENDDELCGAVMGKAVLLTFTRRQVVTDALSYLSRAAEKGVKGAAVELCAWYAGRVIANDLVNFPNADVGLTDCYDQRRISRALHFREALRSAVGAWSIGSVKCPRKISAR